MLTGVALVISLAAFVVSCASLYLTSLAPAEIEVDPIGRAEVTPGNFSGPEPLSNDVYLPLFVSNTGTRGGLLHYVRATGIDVRMKDGVEPFWTAIASEVTMVGAVGGPNLQALALEAGDVRTVYIGVNLQLNTGSLEEHAARIGALESLAVTVQWSFYRTSPFDAKRELITKSLIIDVDTRPCRDGTITFWRDKEEFRYLAEIADEHVSA